LPDDPAQLAEHIVKGVVSDAHVDVGDTVDTLFAAISHHVLGQLVDVCSATIPTLAGDRRCGDGRMTDRSHSFPFRSSPPFSSTTVGGAIGRWPAQP